MPASAIEGLRSETVGIEVESPLLGGGTRQFVNLDNASSTPTFRPVMNKVDEFMRFYSNVARGTGFKSQIASWAFEESRRAVARFVNADPTCDAVIFTRNTTESMNRLAALFPFKSDSIVLTTMMEHHSNDLPWRRRAQVVHARVLADGSLDMEDFATKLAQYHGRVALVAVTGASNVTGWVNPVHELARLAHNAGARIAIDAAQVAPHRPIDMRKPDDPERLDFIAFSGHKTYAPYGIGVLIGSKDLLHPPVPSLVGGGVVDLVTLDSIVWRGLPSREEAGTPGVVGAVALAAAIAVIESVGWDAIRHHEDELTRHTLERLSQIPGIRIYGSTSTADLSRRLGVIAFNLEGRSDALVAAIMAYEAGVGARCGLFCAHPYVITLLDLRQREVERIHDQITLGNMAGVPGVVRASFGLYNDLSDADALCESLTAISQGRHAGYQAADPRTGEYRPTGYERLRPEDYFSLNPR
jgi:selenocysteine lyase/cysteine desulfurase